MSLSPYTLYERLTNDEGACYLIEESLNGARTVM